MTFRRAEFEREMEAFYEDTYHEEMERTDRPTWKERFGRIEVKLAYQLTDEDRALVAATIAGVDATNRQGVEVIHRTMLSASRRKRAELLDQLQWTERSIALRELSLEALKVGHVHNYDRVLLGGGMACTICDEVEP